MLKKRRSKFTSVFLLSLLFLSSCHFSVSKPNETPRLIKTENGISEYQLSNGLQILLLEDHSTPVTTSIVKYKAGTGNEFKYPLQTSHLLEHMTMKSTAHYNRQTGKTQAEMLQSAGAVMNATTEEDETTFFETLPSKELPLALDIQADRMRGVLFEKDDIGREKKVVQDELFALANSPDALLVERVWKKAFRKHPYGNGSAGARLSVANITPQELKSFYDAYYWPNNAVLTIVGDFNSKLTLQLIGEKFSKIPKSREPISPIDVQEPEQHAKRHAIIFGKDGREAVLISHKIPNANHADFFPLQVLNQILSSGRTSRLYPALVESGLAVGVESEVSKLKNEGLFSSLAYLASNSTHKQIGETILKVYEDIKTNGISPAELLRAKQQLKADLIFGRDGSFNVAAELAGLASLGDWTLFETEVNKIEAVTESDVKRVANTYLIPQKMTIGNLVSKKSNNISNVLSKKSVQKQPAKIFKKELQSKLPDSTMKTIDWNQPIASQTLTQNINGIKLISLKTSAKSFVAIEGSFEGLGHAFSEKPLLSDLTVSMLGRATKLHSADELAEIMENENIHISFGSDYKRLNVSIRALKEDEGLAIQLLSEMLLKPEFDNDEFIKLKEQFKIQIMEKMSDPFERGYLEFKRNIYKPRHPNREASFEERLASLNKLTLRDVEKFYEDHKSFKNFTLVAVGDIDTSIAAELEKSFHGLKTKEVKATYSKYVVPLPTFQKKISIPGKNGIEVFMGHETPLNQSMPDYPAAFLANFILGGDFSARLLTKVREEMGLTYHVASNFGGMAGNDLEGHWVLNMTAKPDSLERAIEEVKKQVLIFVKDGVTPDELTKKKSTVIGRLKVDLGTTDGLSGWLLRNEQLNLGIQYADEFPQLIEKLKLEEVNEAIRHYIRPNHLSLVIAGDESNGETGRQSADNTVK